MPSLKMPKLSLAAKLYTIFALLAAASAALGTVAVLDAHRHGALLDEYESVSSGARNVERVNGLIYAVVMESRGIYMSADVTAAKRFGDNLLKFNDQIAKVVGEWRHHVRSEERTQFDEFSKRIEQFIGFRRELVRLGVEVSPAKGREWGDNEANRSVRTALNKDLDALAALYARQTERIHALLDSSNKRSTVILSTLGSLAMLLAAIGAVMIRRAVARPLADLTRITVAVANGASEVSIPFAHRRDEIGALARSIEVFQAAMRRNEELNRAVTDETSARLARAESVTAEIARFAREIETTLEELGRISARVSGSADRLGTTSDEAAQRTASATTASAEASSNVRDIASATEELTASVMEIDRQVSQSKAVAEKAVTDAERSNTEIKALDDAAKRIGDVIKLITAIAEQTNLLALNATIEAARAGEAGKGFAVVAGEVKALASQTAKATEDISTQVTGMQQATMRSVEAIGGIQRTIREVGEVTNAIAAAVTEQSAATREIARSAETAAQRTLETSEEIRQVTQATEMALTDASDVKQVAGDLQAVATRIRGQAEGFFQRLRA